MSQTIISDERQEESNINDPLAEDMVASDSASSDSYLDSLVIRSQQGEPDALAELWQASQPIVQSVYKRINTSPSRANDLDDCCQETYMVLQEKISTLENVSKLWIPVENRGEFRSRIPVENRGWVNPVA